MNHQQVAYVSRLVYPESQTNAIQTMQMAAAFAVQTKHTALFVHDLDGPETEIRQRYSVTDSPLQLWPLRTGRWPTLLYERGILRFVSYNSAVAAVLGMHRTWRRSSRDGKPTQKILFVRSRLEMLYWGLLRPYLWWLRDWVFICEMHDLPIPLLAQDAGDYDWTSPHARRLASALRGYDLVLAVTHSLADDIRRLTDATVTPVVSPLCTGLARSPAPATGNASSERIVLGYVGTLDRAHGVDNLLQSLALLPERYHLRLVGRIRDRAWIEQILPDAQTHERVTLVPPVPYAAVAAEIDQCDMVLAPAGETLHSNRYRSPLKLFDYMARGKPIVAADVPCHRELLQDGVNASIYRRGDPQDLADRIVALVETPDQRAAIAHAAWEASVQYTYPARARSILKLAEAVHQPRHLLHADEVQQIPS